MNFPSDIFWKPYIPRTEALAIPDTQWNDTPLQCLTVNDQWASHIIGVLEALAQRDTWLGTETEVDGALNQVDQIIAALMEVCEDMSDRPIRLNADGLVESRHPDTGDWLLDTSRDPRELVPLNKPLDIVTTTDLKKTYAAYWIVGMLQENQLAVAAALAGADPRHDITTAMLATLEAVNGVVMANDFYTVLAEAAGLYVSGADATYFTDFFQNGVDDSVWGVFMCAAACHMDDDGVFSQTAWQAMKADIAAAYSDVLTGNQYIRIWFQQIANLIGRNGFTNAGRSWWQPVYPLSVVFPDDCTCP